MKLRAIALFLLVTGCSDPVKDAQAELAMLRKAKASADELCDAEQKIARAMIEAHDERRFPFQKQVADQACLNAEMERGLTK